MMNEKKVPQLRFRGFEDEWKKESFSNLTYISARKNKEDLPLESYSITSENGFVPQDEQFENGGTMKDADKSMYWIVPPKSFGYNPARINVGSIGYYAGEKEVIVSSLYEIFKLTENCSDDFFWHWFKSEKLQKLVERLQEGGVRLYFYYDKLCMGEIKLPSLSEQQKIGTLLSQIDSFIQAKTQKLESLKSVKKSLLQKCFPKDGAKVPEMRFDGFSGEWKEAVIGDVSEIITGGTPSTEKIEYWDNKEIPWLSSGEVNKKRITFTDDFISKNGYENSSATWIPENSVLIALAGQGKTRGTVAINKIPLTTNQSIAGIVLNKNMDAEFIFQNLEGKYIQIRKMSSGDGSRGGLNKQLVSEINFMYPPTLDEQIKIGKLLEKYDSLIALQQQEIDKLKTIKKALLQKMFV